MSTIQRLNRKILKDFDVLQDFVCYYKMFI
jgi:hypothetical protein